MSASVRIALVIILALAVPIVPFVVIGEMPGERWLSAHDAQAWKFGLSGAGLLAADVVLPLPSSVIGTMLGARLGFAAGFAFAWCGLMCGALAGYVTGRLLLGRMQLPEAGAPTLLAVLVSRPVPVLAEALAIAAGAARTPFLPFVGMCAAGNAVYAGVLTGNGATLLPKGMTVVGLVVPLALPVVAWLAWQWHRKLS